MKKNRSMKVPRPNLGKNVIIALKDKNGRDERQVQKFYSELYEI